MERVVKIQQLLLRSRRLPWLVLGVTLLTLAGAILLTTLRVRERIREQIAGRDGEVLHAVALMAYTDDVGRGLTGPITDPGSQLSIVLKSSQLKGVLGIRLFDPAGRLMETFPPYVLDGALSPQDLPRLQRLKPVSHFHSHVRLSDLFFPDNGDSTNVASVLPLLEVNVPLHTDARDPLAGVAQFLIEGHSIAAEYARLDRHLALQALGAFGAGGGILVLAISWAFRRLRRAHQLLTERTQHLIQANQELALAAKTSALGALTAHLIHGLKNPLAGLQSFVATRGTGPGEDPEADWDQALASTRRMQALINQVVRVLREEQTGARYEVTLAELAEMVSHQVMALARETGVQVLVRRHTEAVLPNRVVHLVTLVLVNLLQNAIQATPQGKSATLTIKRAGEQLVFEVRDEGPGFPAHLKPFTPCRSTKEGGGGIGLALSKQLAHHLGAGLELQGNSPDGCMFTLTLPVTAGVEKSNVTPVSIVG